MITTMLVRRVRPATSFVLLAVVAVLVGVGLTGCGGNSTRAPAASTSASASGAAGAAPSGVSSTAKCQKVRFALHAGLAAGAAHRYLWKPYRAGTFAPGANGRKTALVKAALASAFTVHELRIALTDIQGCPSTQALTESVRSGLGQAQTLATSVKSGTVDPGALSAVDGSISSIESRAHQAGIDVREQDPTAGQLAGGSTGE